MDVAQEARRDRETRSTKKMQQLNKRNERRYLSSRISFSASLPDDVCGGFADSLCAVMYSMDPLLDMRESILEMIREVGVHDWNEMEELVYCYIALNSSEVHEFIAHAFISVCSPL